MAMRGRLRDDAFRVHGFSGKKFRLFLNNLIQRGAGIPAIWKLAFFMAAKFLLSPYLIKKLRVVGI